MWYLYHASASNVVQCLKTSIYVWVTVVMIVGMNVSFIEPWTSPSEMPGWYKETG